MPHTHPLDQSDIIHLIQFKSPHLFLSSWRHCASRLSFLSEVLIHYIYVLRTCQFDIVLSQPQANTVRVPLRLSYAVLLTKIWTFFQKHTHSQFCQYRRPSAEWCFFHLLTLYYACINLKILSVVSLPKSLSIFPCNQSRWLWCGLPQRHTSPGREVASSWFAAFYWHNLQYRICKLQTAPNLYCLDLIRYYKLFNSARKINSVVVSSSLLYYYHTVLSSFPYFFYRILAESFQEFQSSSGFQESLHQSEDKSWLQLLSVVQVWSSLSLDWQLLVASWSILSSLVFSKQRRIVVIHEISS